ncbi:hypothetical protein ACH419_30455 [Streptomyces bobili]|uniref:hypothetical protein n=1 Tax=Streptomyces bobili TaxID=67280 RepID=UPI0037AF04BD
MSDSQLSAAWARTTARLPAVHVIRRMHPLGAAGGFVVMSVENQADQDLLLTDHELRARVISILDGEMGPGCDVTELAISVEGR